MQVDWRLSPLPAKYVIHTVGPIWSGGNQGEESLLRSCYRTALGLAKAHGFASIAFPLISTGVYGYPKEQALQVAISEFTRFLLDNEMTIYLVVFDRETVQLSGRLAESLRQFVDDHYVEEHVGDLKLREARENVHPIGAAAAEKLAEKPPAASAPHAPSAGHFAIPQFLRKSKPVDLQEPVTEADTVTLESDVRGLDQLVANVGESFSDMVLRLIRDRGFTDVEVYKRANLDRKLFSKIRSNPDYAPSKKTAVALAIGLRLSLDESLDLLGRAGFTLSHSSVFDLVVEYFIRQGNYNIFEINEALFAYDVPTLS